MFLEDNKDYMVVTDFVHRHHLSKNIPGWVLINSSGGNVYNMTPVYDWVRLHKINTIAEGRCESAGFNLFTAGEKRISYASTVFMQHGNSIESSSKSDRDNVKNHKA